MKSSRRHIIASICDSSYYENKEILDLYSDSAIVLIAIKRANSVLLQIFEYIANPALEDSTDEFLYETLKRLFKRIQNSNRLTGYAEQIIRKYLQIRTEVCREFFGLDVVAIQKKDVREAIMDFVKTYNQEFIVTLNASLDLRNYLFSRT